MNEKNLRHEMSKCFLAHFTSAGKSDDRELPEQWLHVDARGW